MDKMDEYFWNMAQLVVFILLLIAVAGFGIWLQWRIVWGPINSNTERIEVLESFHHVGEP